MIKIRFGLIFWLLLVFAAPVHAQGDDTLITVGLSYGNPAYNQGSIFGKDLYLSAEGRSLSLGVNEVGYSLYEGKARVLVADISQEEEALRTLKLIQGRTPDAFLGFDGDYAILSETQAGGLDPGDFKVELTGDFGRILILSESVLLRNQSTSFYFDGLRYRGAVGFSSHEGSLSVINELTQREYLYGVVPKEMGYTWPREALKAQAVLARTYLTRHMGQYEAYGFDICGTANCQAYGGFTAERAATSAAVEDTAGERAYYEGEPIYAYYHANSGGITADVKNVWGGSYPYLVSREDPFSQEAVYSDWQIDFTGEELLDLIRERGYQAEAVLDVDTGAITTDGRVQSLTITTDREAITLVREEARRFFGYNILKSTYYRVSFSDPLDLLLAGGEVRSLPEEISAINGEGVLTRVSKDWRVLGEGYSRMLDCGEGGLAISGRGWGHGVGMSQYGAREMADLGYDYRQIIAFYYPGVEVRE